MFNKKSKEEFDVQKQRLEKQKDRRQKVYYLQPKNWVNEVKEFEKDFQTFIEENTNMPNHLEKYWERMGIIKIKSLEPLIFSIKDIIGYERNQMKWDALQELRCRRKFVSQQSMAGITGEQQETEVIF
jgi:hypothetical protein